MLVLARRVGEELIIGDNIVVTVLSITGKIVRLGFDAPEDTRVERIINGNCPAEVGRELRVGTNVGGTEK